jgi:hypothetical protein
MSVHSTYYEDEEEYERDLKWEYRREQWEQDHPEELQDIDYLTESPQDIDNRKNIVIK